MPILNSIPGSAILLVLSIILFILLCTKGLHAGIAALVATIIVSLGAAEGFAPTLFTVFNEGVGTLTQMMFLVFTAAGLLG
jgi:H+/gluconate symporter-like permease